MTDSIGAGLPRRVLGRTGIEVSAVGIGCWPIGGPDHNLGLPMGWGPVEDSDAVAALERAVELGANLFDTADVYGHGRSERLLGRLVAQVRRDSVVLVSKVGYFAGTAPHGFDPGHMRRQLEQTLQNLGTDYLDVYSLHHADFGPDDRYLDGAVEAMRTFRERGLIRAIGMRGPHRFALDRLSTPAALRGDKVARFRALFEAVRPDVLAVRDNLLTPDGPGTAGVVAVADREDCGVLVTKPLAQGLLTGSYAPSRPRVFGPGDHRGRKRWFTPAAVAVVADGLEELRQLVGPEPGGLIRIALWACLARSARAVTLVGFTRSDQVTTNLTCLGEAPEPATIAAARGIMAGVQARLDATGQVFLDEVLDGAAPR